MKVPKPRKLPSGSWFIQLRLNGVSVPVTAATERECKRQAELIKAEHRAGKREVAKASTDPTLRQAIDIYIGKRKNTLSPSTIDGYRRIQRNRFQAYMDKPLSRLKDWQKICDEEAELCAPKTLRNAYRFIVSVLSENGVASKKVTLPVMIPHTREWLDPEQITVLVESSRGTSAEFPVLLALHSLRRSEMLALEWEDIDLRRNILRISGAVVQDESHAFVKKAANKNETSTRIIPIMIPALREMLEQVPQDERQGAVIPAGAPYAGPPLSLRQRGLLSIVSTPR